jgi:hypothetical protein
MATLRARRSSRTSLAIRLTMIAVSVIFGETSPKRYALRVSAMVRRCQSKMPLCLIAFFDLASFAAADFQEAGIKDVPVPVHSRTPCGETGHPIPFPGTTAMPQVAWLS